jgi:hypothetical protein
MLNIVSYDLNCRRIAYIIIYYDEHHIYSATTVYDQKFVIKMVDVRCINQ